MEDNLQFVEENCPFNKIAVLMVHTRKESLKAGIAHFLACLASHNTEICKVCEDVPLIEVFTQVVAQAKTENALCVNPQILESLQIWQ